MADIRCPMCSKPNAADAEVCQHCQARLKPLIVSPQSDEPAAPLPPSEAPLEGKPSQTPQSADSGDWLGDLRSEEDDDDSFDAGAESDGFDNNEDDGDWFSRLDEGDDTSSPEAVSPENAPSDAELSGVEPAEKPEWLKPPSDEGDPNIPDWMEELGVSVQEPSVQAGEDGVEQPVDENKDDLENWLAGLTEGREGDQVASSDDETLVDDEKSWMSEDEDDVDQSLPEAEKAEEIPDWLSSPHKADEPEISSEPVSADEADSDVPDWLISPGGLPEPVVEDGAGASSSDELPDWLSSVETPDLSAESSDDAEFIPSWVTQAEDEASAGEFPAAGAPVPAEDTSTQPVIEGDASEEAPATSPTKKPFQTGTLDSDFLSDDATPDWLSDLDQLSIDEDVDTIEEDEALASAAPAESLPDWLADVGNIPIEDDAVSALDGDDSSALVPSEEAAAQDAAGEGAFSEIGSTPDWLENVTAPDTDAEEVVLAADEADVAPAELPSWLEAMRPVEAAAPMQYFRDESDTRVESAGPLSGLRGILQAEPDIDQFQKPPVYSNKLQLTEAHQVRIALLEELTAAEGKPKSVQPFVPIKAQTALRLVVAIGLILAIFFGMMWDKAQQVPLPAGELPVEIRNLRGSIEQLSPSAPVLVAVDYDAGTSVEMDYPARVVLGQLEEKGAFLSFVSTSLSGPMLSELLLRQLDHQSGITYTHYTNLGYIPGGSAGLLSFARNPRQTLPTALSGAGWKSASLGEVNWVADFVLVVVMTDNADTARLWVEQVHPWLHNTPMVMVLSAQAEPMVRPYFQSGVSSNQAQIAGYVAGISGAAAYQHKLAPQVVWKEWDALSMASILALIVIALGGLFNLGLAVSSRPKSKR